MKTEGKCQKNKKEEEGEKTGEVLCTESLLGLAETGDNQTYLQRRCWQVNTFDMKQESFLWLWFLSFAVAELMLTVEHSLCGISAPRYHPVWGG